MTQSIVDFKILFSVSIYFSAPVSLQKTFLQCWTLLSFLNCTLWHLLIQLVWVVHKFWKELPLQQWLLRGSWENQLIWIAGILLNYWGLWQFILAKDCVFTLCLRDEYGPDGIPLLSLLLSFIEFAWKQCQFFLHLYSSNSSSPSLLHFLLFQHLFCFIAWSQELVPLICSCIHKQPRKVTMSSNTNITSSSFLP